MKHMYKISAKKIGAMLLAAACMAGCAEVSVKNPFVEEKPFAPSQVPDDFAIIIDRETANYYSREHVQQVVTQQDKMSHTAYRTFRDYNNTLSNSFDSHFPLSPEQLQAMWNEVAKHDLMVGGTLWLNSYSDANKYRLSQNQVQIRANGKIKIYTAANGYPTNMRPLIQQLDSIRLATGQVNAPVVETGSSGGPGPAEAAPATSPASTMSVDKALNETTTQPSTAPAVEPPATQPATLPHATVSTQRRYVAMGIQPHTETIDGFDTITFGAASQVATTAPATAPATSTAPATATAPASQPASK